MARTDPDTNELKEQLADALAQVDALQTALADAEARAATQGERIAAVEGERENARAEAERLGERLKESAMRYREARLSASPEVPSELVTGTEIEEIDEQMEAAGRVVAEMRERLERERKPEAGAVPAGSPVRRSPDYSALPAAEKIKMGLQQRG